MFGLSTLISSNKWTEFLNVNCKSLFIVQFYPINKREKNLKKKDVRRSLSWVRVLQVLVLLVRVLQVQSSPVQSSPVHEIQDALLSGRFELLIISESKIDATLPNSMFHCSLSDSFRLCRDSKAGDSGLLIYGSFHICFIRAKQLKRLPSTLLKKKKKLSLTEDLSLPNLFGKFVKHCAHAGWPCCVSVLLSPLLKPYQRWWSSITNVTA